VALSLTASPVAQAEEPAPSGAAATDPTSSDVKATDIGATAGLADDLAQIRRQIADAEQDLARYEGGLIKGLIQARLEVLRLSEAMLAQKELASKTGATFAFTLPASPTDAKRAQFALRERHVDRCRKPSQSASRAVRAPLIMAQ